MTTYLAPAMISKVVLCLISLIAISSCSGQSVSTTPTSANVQAESFSYQVFVQDNENNPISDASVTLSFSSYAPITTFTDSIGVARLLVDQPALGKAAQLLIKARGFTDYSLNIDLSENLPKIVKLTRLATSHLEETISVPTVAPLPSPTVAPLPSPTSLSVQNASLPFQVDWGALVYNFEVSNPQVSRQFIRNPIGQVYEFNVLKFTVRTKADFLFATFFARFYDAQGMEIEAFYTVQFNPDYNGSGWMTNNISEATIILPNDLLSLKVIRFTSL